MGYTKRAIVDAAYAELALAGHVFDLDTETLQGALLRLDAMCGAWESQGVSCGYRFPAEPGESDVDHDSGIGDGGFEAVFMSLAVRLAAGHGKTVAADTRSAARAGFNALAARCAIPPPTQMPGGFPLGAGNLRHGIVFTGDPQ